MTNKSKSILLIVVAATAFLLDKFYLDSGFLKLAAFAILGIAVFLRSKGKRSGK